MANSFNSYFDKSDMFTACPSNEDAHIVWSRKIFKPILGDTVFGNILHENGLRGIVKIDTQLEKEPGTGVVTRMISPLRGDGVTGCETLTGREECPPESDMRVDVKNIRDAVCMERCGCWDAQRGAYVRSRSDAMDQLKDWLAHKILSPSFIHQVTGYTGVSFVDYLDNITPMKEQYRGFNTIYSPSHHFAAKGSDLVAIAGRDDGEQAITSEDKMSVKLLHKISALLGNNCYGRIRPLSDKDGKYVLFLHPSQMADLKSDPEWGNTIVNADVRGKSNRLFTGALGVFDGIILRDSCEIPNGLYPNGSIISNVRRAVLLGADAATLVVAGYCKRNSAGRMNHIPFRIDYESKDYGHRTNLAIEMIFGIAKNRFNGKDLSSVVISTYAENSRFTDSSFQMDSFVANPERTLNKPKENKK